MSADRWTQCPKCVDTIQVAHIKAKEALKNMYGTMPADEFVEKMNKLEQDPGVEQNFREDWEIGVFGNGLTIRYYGQCRDCGFTVEIDEDRTIYPPEPENDDEGI